MCVDVFDVKLLSGNDQARPCRSDAKSQVATVAQSHFSDLGDVLPVGVVSIFSVREMRSKRGLANRERLWALGPGGDKSDASVSFVGLNYGAWRFENGSVNK